MHGFNLDKHMTTVRINQVGSSHICPVGVARVKQGLKARASERATKVCLARECAAEGLM